MSILAINSGSTSLKFGVFDAATGEPLLAGEFDWAHGDRRLARFTLKPHRGETIISRLAVPDDFTATESAIKAVREHRSGGSAAIPAITLVGHRVVHGGAEFRDSVLIDAKVKSAIGSLSRLAPLHNPHALQAIEAAERLLPGVPQVATFDTAFFAQLPPKAFLYALPYEYYERWGIRRFGFHGLSHAYCASRAAELINPSGPALRLITCHLGGGCSAAAVQNGVAVATTLGFSPLEGLMMGTRPGSVDPGILLHLQREHGLPLEQLDLDLNYSSGLLGISGLSPDLGQIETAAAQGNQRAQLAFDMFADRVRSAIGGLAATLGGVDVLVFTDRVGERSAALRAAACEGLEFMGLRLDPQRNANAVPDVDIARADSSARILVIHTQEELIVAREARRVTSAKPPLAS
ncbi:MAG TPA: acetate kinase [Clostridia bacterium]|nr:acetate kinase [Clostridia bacterium]